MDIELSTQYNATLIWALIYILLSSFNSLFRVATIYNGKTLSEPKKKLKEKLKMNF